MGKWAYHVGAGTGSSPVASDSSESLLDTSFLFGRTWTKLDSTTLIQNSLRAKLQRHIMFGSILQLQIILSGSKEMDARIA